MATVVSKKISIDENNIKQYCEANNVSFDVSGHAWRKWLNGSADGYVILKTEGKSEIYPTDTAHPFKADSTISASRSAGTCKVELQFGGTSVHLESYTSGSQTSKSKSDITDAAVTNSTKATEIKWHVNGKNGDNQRGDLLELTLYFNQYAVAANVGTSANGIQSASVSNATPYQGDSVTFTPKLVNGATWHGWYSDASCTTLVSTDQNYTVSPSSDLALYANATIDVTTYTCSAVAKDWILSAEVSDSIVPEGGSCTFTAQASNGYTFGGWYSDSDCTVRVSTDNPYTTTITANTTLYAKAHISKLNISVGTAEHGTASVSASVINYGDNAVFTFTPESDDYELYGWYSDEGLTQLVSEANPYTCTPTSDYKLWPKTGMIRYKITLTSPQIITNITQFTLTIFAYYESKLSEQDVLNLHKGQFDNLDLTKFEGEQSVTGRLSAGDVTVALDVPKGCTCFLHSSDTDAQVCICPTKNLFDETTITNWPYYTFVPTSDQEYFAKNVGKRCNCSGVAKDGIAYTDVTNPTAQGTEAVFKAKAQSGYAFKGWYSDEACTTLVSSDNPANVITPVTSSVGETTSLTLYAKAEPITISENALFFKANGSYTQVSKAYKKVSGSWVEQTDVASLFDGASSGSSTNYVYGGSV